MRRLFTYYKYNFFSMFLIGLLGGVGCLMTHIILSGIVSENFKFEYSAVTKISIEGPNIDVTEKECNELINTREVKEEIKSYLGSYISYEEFQKNYSLKLEDKILTIEYFNENEDRAKRSANRLGNVLCRRLISQQKIEDYNKIGITETDRIKKYEHNAISKLPVTLFVEFGIVAGIAIGFVIYTIVYIVNGKIKSEKDIEDELNIHVLASIPRVDKLGEVR